MSKSKSSVVKGRHGEHGKLGKGNLLDPGLGTVEATHTHSGSHTDSGSSAGTTNKPIVGFTFSADLSSVTAMSLTFKGQSLSLATTGLTVNHTTGDTPTVTSVVQSIDNGVTSNTTAWVPVTGATNYEVASSVKVAKVSNFKLSQHKFTFDAQDAITADQEQVITRWGKSTTWNTDTIDSNEVYRKQTVDGKTYVGKTESHTNGTTTVYDFHIYRDDNADGIWTEIANGKTNSQYIDSASHIVDIAQLQTLLAASASVVG
ncbi:MAG: hypothetical protein QM520_03260 [Gammaproteobacteria bacterium]|nr:hypothetical protein [Gammaproteobacteria bacterium]